MRLTLVATGLVMIALAIAAVVMVEALHHVLLRNADAETSARAEQIAGSIRTERGPAGIDQSQLATSKNVAAIQITDASGAIRVTNNPMYSRPLAPPLEAGHRLTVHGARATDTDQEFQATALGVGTANGTFTVQVGAEEAPINATVAALGVLCSIVFPFIVIGMAILTYVFVGRALRPVDDIRVRVEEITGGDLDQQVPVPATADEIAALARTMNEMLHRIALSRQRQLQFVNDASHELNSPLTTIVGLLDLSSTTCQPIDADTVDSVLLPDALRLQRMVADLLILARADESGIPLRVDDVDLDEIVNTEAVRLDAVTTHTVDVSLKATRVSGDADKLARALRNVVDNAMRYAVSRIAIRMDVDDDRHTVSVTVSDDGPGIPDGEKSRVTDRFVRLDTSRQRGSGGSGLGLSIVTEIVRAHGGVVVIEDSDHGGASVGFRLPLQQMDTQSPPSSANR